MKFEEIKGEYVKNVVNEMAELSELYSIMYQIEDIDFSTALKIIQVAELKKINDNLSMLLDKNFYEIKDDDY